MNATSQYLNRPVRLLADVERMSEPLGGTDREDRLDQFQHLIDRLTALRAEFAARNGKGQLGKIDVAFEMACLDDVLADLEGKRQEIQEQE